jgi:hypothetical protein
MAHDDGIDDNDIGYSAGELLSYDELCELEDLRERADQVGGDHAN